GISISEGIAIGTLHLLEEIQPREVPRFSITKREVNHEIQRYRKALSSSREDLFRVQESLAKEGSVEAITIIDGHIQMLQDPFMTTMMENRIHTMLFNTEAVFQTAIQEYEAQFSKIADAFFRQRLTDVKDLSSRILKHLSPQTKRAFSHLPPDSILVARELALSDTAEAPKEKVKAFLSQVGSNTSHAALIARAKGIPYISSLDVALFFNHKNCKVIVDGTAGLVILRPSDKTLAKYEKLKEEHHKKMLFFSQHLLDQAKTKDGEKIHVYANIENINDAPLIEQFKADGIGLFRSEYIFLTHQTKDFSEESQFEIYRNFFKRSGQKPIYFRVFDIGGDKQFFKSEYDEANPALGCRSIRFLLRHRDFFRLQLRAFLRAASGYNVHLMLPLITDVDELLEVKRFIELISTDLIASGHRIKKNLKIGSMIEVPAAVMMSEAIAEHSDFFSIGTNDLIQYTLAVDRVNSSIAEIYQPSHPSIIRMLDMIARSAKAQRIPVSICGEMASNPLFTALLIGMGINHLSCSPRYVPLIKHTVCKINMKEARELSKKALTLKTAHDIHRLLTEDYCRHGD
ncbi:MAG: phosphoenolpyruvate--protein phosphotransferase, partial [Simkaniaceae bacterium]|nr:phosphoenolpyruvate--protein phosphotransferase [Simkaniaceae bacterium]